jgi:aspartyl-tRNA(Asn)/glutamyl-tRNA(Gln) amidotransferase subunit A
VASADVPLPDFTAGLGRDLKGLRLAYSRDFFATQDGLSPEVTAALDAAAQRFAELGAEVAQVALPDFELFDACGRVILVAEAYAIHERDLLTRPGDYARYTYQRMMVGATLSAADLTQALRLRRELALRVNRDILGTYDAIITANGLSPAPRLDAFPADASPKMTLLTIPFNVTGNPALALPTGFSSSGLPIGLQLVGRPFDEPNLLRIAAAYEAAAGTTARRPPCVAAAA